MASFLPAYNKTNRVEGGFANNPDDKGGMTVWGIARVPNPNWKGWPTVDLHLKNTTPQPPYGTASYYQWARYVNGILNADTALAKMKLDFYEANYWKSARLDQVENQEVAEWIYDHHVNAGARGIMWAQLAARVKPDGGVGPVTLSAINTMPSEEFLTRAADISGAYRLDKASKDPSQLQFVIGWMRRDGQPESIIQMVKDAARDGKLDVAEVATIKDAMEATA